MGEIRESGVVAAGDSRSGDLRLCVVGPMVAKYGRVTTQDWVVANLFGSAGWSVVRCSEKPGRLARLADVVATLLREGRGCDVMYLSVYSGRAFLIADVASRIGRRAGQAVVVVLHGGALPRFAARFPRWLRRVLRRADAIVAPTPFLAREAEAWGFQAQVIPNVIDLEQYGFRLREALRPRLLWMRTFDRVWNPLMAVRVLERLRARWPEARLVMGGEDRGMRGVVEADVRRRGLEGHVEFPGFLDMEGKRREMEAAEVFLTTNRVDNMPVAVVEAAAMGLPVVSTRVGGIPEFLTDGETALLVPDDDDAAMAASVGRLLSEPGLAARLSRNGRLLAERSAWSVVRPQWEELFRRVVAARPRRRARTSADAR